MDIKKTVKDYALMVVGALIYGISVSSFLDPNAVAPGGMTGLAVVLNRVIHVETGTILLCLNIPVMIYGVWKFGLRFLAKTIFAVFFCSMFTNFFGQWGALTEDLFVAAAAGGVLLAVGMALIFMAGGTTGGTDIIVKGLRQKYRHLKTGTLILMLDMIIIALSGLVFKNINIIVYAVASVYIESKVFDAILYMGESAKMIYIITEKPDNITKRLLNDMEVGVTILEGTGAWTGNKKTVLFCAVQVKNGPEVQRIVKEEDSSAFMIFTDSSEIYGEGYKDFSAEEL